MLDFFVKPERVLGFFLPGGICMLTPKTVYISCGLWIPRIRSNVRDSCASAGWILRYSLPQAESALSLHPPLRPGYSICVPFEIILANQTITSHSLGSQNDILTVSPIVE